MLFGITGLVKCKVCGFLHPGLPQFLLLSLRNLGVEPLSKEMTSLRKKMERIIMMEAGDGLHENASMMSFL